VELIKLYCILYFYFLYRILAQENRAARRSCLEFGGEGSLGDLGFDVGAGLESLFPSDDLGDTLDEDVDELDFGLAESVSVGDVPGTAGGGGVDTSGSSGLEKG
jgi:hypothetical protein